MWMSQVDLGKGLTHAEPKVCENHKTLHLDMAWMWANDEDTSECITGMVPVTPIIGNIFVNSPLGNPSVMYVVYLNQWCTIATRY